MDAYGPTSVHFNMMFNDFNVFEGSHRCIGLRRYKFKDFNFMKTISELSNYNKYTFKLDDLLSFLPNIFFVPPSYL